MAQIPHVQPGDIISSELINAIIDALGGLDEKITKCCEEHKQPEPEPEEPKGKIFIREVVSADPVYGEMIDIRGGGFLPEERGNDVSIADELVTTFGKVTGSLIQAEVPTTITFKKRTPAAVSVRNRNGLAEYKITVGPGKSPDVPFVPTDKKVIDEMLKLAGVNKADIVYDLGSGDGRIVVEAAAEFNARKAVGIELDEELIRKAEILARKSGVWQRVEFRKEDLFTADISEATVVALHLLPELNVKLRPRLEKLLKAGTRIVSHTFDMGTWKPVKHSNNNGRDVYLWVVGK